MNPRTLFHRHPVPTLVTTAFLFALVATMGYFAGLIPNVPKTLPTFVDLTMVTVVLLVIAVLSWTMALAVR